MSAGEPSLAELLQEHGERLHRHLGPGANTRLFFSPGRVNLMGAHLDYNGGIVMPSAIDRGSFFAVRQRADRSFRMGTTLDDQWVEGHLDQLPRARTGFWTDYPLGVLSYLQRQDSGGFGFDLLLGGNLPIGAGLSSSASICVGMAFVFGALWERELVAQDWIEAALWAEREFIGVHCGIMDPYAISMTQPGHLLMLDCKDISIEHVPLDAKRITIAVADTGVRRELAQVAFNERVAQCSAAYKGLRPFQDGIECLRDVHPETLERHGSKIDPVVRMRAQHVIDEVQRTRMAREALLAGDLPGFGAQMTAAHASLRDLFDVSIEELDALVESACEWDGMYGTRLTGAGFGGCTVMTVDTERCEGLEEHLQADFERRYGTRPHVEFFRPSAGPRELT